MKENQTKIINDILADIKESENLELSQKENMINFAMSALSIDDAKAKDIAERIIDANVNFSQSIEIYHNSNAKELFKEKVIESIGQMDLKEQYEYLKNILFALQSTSKSGLEVISENVDLTSQLENLRNNVPDIAEEEITGEIIAGLVDQIAIGVELCGSLSIIRIFSSTKKDEVEKTEKFKDTVTTEKLVYDEWDKMKLKNYMTLAAYIAYQEEKLPEVPRGLDIEELSIFVSSNIEAGEVIGKAIAGETTWEKAMEVLKIIAMVTGAMLIVYASISVAILIASLILLAPTLPGLFIAFGMGIVLFLGLNVMCDSSEEILEKMSNAAVISAEFIKDACEAIYKWIQKSVQWVENKIYNHVANNINKDTTAETN